MRPLLYFQPILQLDLRWPLTLICDLWLHQQMSVPMLIYDPTLVEIHQSMWKWSQMLTLFHNNNVNNSGQSDPYVSFLLRQVTQKWGLWESCSWEMLVFHGGKFLNVNELVFLYINTNKKCDKLASFLRNQHFFQPCQAMGGGGLNILLFFFLGREVG